MSAASSGTVNRCLMIGTLLFFFLATCAMLQQREPFYTWFYSFAWWSYIIFVESFLRARGFSSRLSANPSRFLLLLPLSITLWLLFEAYNFRLQNWHYVDLPSWRGLRWFGFALAYATVLPALFATRNLLDYLGWFRDFRLKPIRLHRSLRLFQLTGAGMLLLPLLLPTIFFPLVWLGFIFLLDPLNYRGGAESILRDLEQGAPRNLCLLLLSGLLCGGFWECWNFWAGAKWIYTVPHLGFFKIFEMPLLGFLGFPPFAVECYVLVNTFFLVLTRIQQEVSYRGQFATYLLLGLGTVSFAAIVFLGIDAFTVVSFRSGN